MITVRGIYRVATAGWANLTAPHAILLAAAQTTLPSRQTDDVGDIDEFTGTGYTGGFGGATRAALASLTVAEDDANQRAELTCAAVSFAGVTAGRAAPIIAIVEEITNDAGSNVIGLVPWKADSNTFSVTAATAASPPVLTATAHGLTTGDVVYIEGFAGGTWAAAVNGYSFLVTVVDANTFSLDGVVATGFGTATFASAKVYTPLTMNGAEMTLTPGADGVLRINVLEPAETS